MKITTFMIADGARLGADGKLYIFGGQWNRLVAPTVPAVQPVALVVVAEVSYEEALKTHRLRICLLSEDGEPVGAEVDATMQFGIPPGTAQGASIQVPLAIDARPVAFPNYGRYEWLVDLDDVHTRAPLDVVPPPKLTLGNV
jgi:hypothetical protein